MLKLPHNTNTIPQSHISLIKLALFYNLQVKFAALYCSCSKLYPQLNIHSKSGTSTYLQMLFYVLVNNLQTIADYFCFTLTILRHRWYSTIPFATHHSIRRYFLNHNTAPTAFPATTVLNDKLPNIIHQRSRQFLIQILVKDVVIHRIFD